eukprot:11191691-Lingulodinium_polyedra.AAC.1
MDTINVWKQSGINPESIGQQSGHNVWNVSATTRNKHEQSGHCAGTAWGRLESINLKLPGNGLSKSETIEYILAQ